MSATEYAIGRHCGVAVEQEEQNSNQVERERR